MKIRRFPTEISATVYVATLIENLLTNTSNPVLGLSTGSTPVKLYRQLVEFHRQGLSFAHAVTINLDEYVGISVDHQQSYHRFMMDHLFSKIDIVSSNTFVPNGMAANLEDECKRYDAILHAHPIDMQILGIGRNGHIGFNEPDLSLKTHTHVIRLTEDTVHANRRFFERESCVPRTYSSDNHGYSINFTSDDYCANGFWQK